MMGMGMGMDMEMEEMGMMMEDEMGSGMDMGMGMMADGGMGGMDGGGMATETAEDRKFRLGLQHAIVWLRKVDGNEDQQQKLRGYIREAFENRYDRMMDKRKQDLAELRRGMEKLELEFRRRQAAKERVVQLQLQSVQLAAEGLLEPNDLQGVADGTPGYPGGSEFTDPFEN